MIDTNQYFVLYSNCISVKGYKRSVICDLQKGCYYFISNETYDVLQDLKLSRVSKVIKKYKRGVVIHIAESLINSNLGFSYSSNKDFPDISLDLKGPNLIHDAIIELSEKVYKQMRKISSELGELGCKVLELRGYQEFSIKKLARIIDELESTRIRSVEIYLKFDQELKMESILALIVQKSIIEKIVVHTSPHENMTMVHKGLVFTKQKIESAKSCGNISKEMFKVNLESFSESKNFNSCLNKKISVNGNGEIKNCPSLVESFGNISKNSLKVVSKSKRFKKLGAINKDKIFVCKDCEFRYICTDCRAYVDEPGNVLSKPLKCGYNPYTLEWNDWDKLREKEAAKIFYAL